MNFEDANKKSIKEVAKEVTLKLVTSDFKKKHNCSDEIFKRVFNQIEKDAIAGLERKQFVQEVFLNQRQRLIAVYQNQVLLHSLNNTPNKKTLNLEYSDSENEKEEEEKKASLEDLFAVSTQKGGLDKKIDSEKKDQTTKNSYFEYLSQYTKDEEIFNRVKGLEMRGRNLKISNNGACPRCKQKKNVFVILDFLFLSGDMPEFLDWLLSKGYAVLWSSKQQSYKCKDPPTFICSGKCPDTSSGFNINWGSTNLEKIFLRPEKTRKVKQVAEEKLEAETGVKDKSEKKEESENKNKEEPQEKEEDSDSEYEVYDEGMVDIDHYREQVLWVVLDNFSQAPPVEEEDKYIRTMLALEEARIDFMDGKMKTREEKSNSLNLNQITAEKIKAHLEAMKARQKGFFVPEQTPPSMPPPAVVVNKPPPPQPQTKTPEPPQNTPAVIIKEADISNSANTKPAFTAADFPVSDNGHCPYCKSKDVVYVIIDTDKPLPPLLLQLLQAGSAKKIKKGEYDLPSFQCKGCTYGFNLDWSKIGLKQIFFSDKMQQEEKVTAEPISAAPPGTSATTTTAASETAYSQYDASYGGYYDPATYQWMSYMQPPPIVATATPPISMAMMPPPVVMPLQGAMPMMNPFAFMPPPFFGGFLPPPPPGYMPPTAVVPAVLQPTVLSSAVPVYTRPTATVVQSTYTTTAAQSSAKGTFTWVNPKLNKSTPTPDVTIKEPALLEEEKSNVENNKIPSVESKENSTELSTESDKSVQSSVNASMELTNTVEQSDEKNVEGELSNTNILTNNLTTSASAKLASTNENSVINENVTTESKVDVLQNVPTQENCITGTNFEQLSSNIVSDEAQTPNDNPLSSTELKTVEISNVTNSNVIQKKADTSTIASNNENEAFGKIQNNSENKLAKNNLESDVVSETNIAAATPPQVSIDCHVDIARLELPLKPESPIEEEVVTPRGSRSMRKRKIKNSISDADRAVIEGLLIDDMSDFPSGGALTPSSVGAQSPQTFDSFTDSLDNIIEPESPAPKRGRGGARGTRVRKGGRGRGKKKT